MAKRGDKGGGSLNLGCEVHYYFYCVMLSRARLCLRMSSVCPPVRPSVTFRYDIHISWNTSKTISRLISLRYLLVLTPRWAIWSNGNTPKLGWNMSGVMNTKPAISLTRCKVTNGLIGSRIMCFRLVPKSMTLGDHGQPKCHSCRDPYYQRQNVGR